MTDEDIEDVFRAARLPVDLSIVRTERLIEDVVARCDRLPRPSWGKAWVLAWREWIVCGTPTYSVRRFAAVLTAVAVFGAVLGFPAEEPEPATQITDLFSAATLFQGES